MTGGPDLGGFWGRGEIGAVLSMGIESGPNFIPPLSRPISILREKKHSLYLLVPLAHTFHIPMEVGRRLSPHF